MTEHITEYDCERIVRLVARRFRVSVEAMFGRRRPARIALARQAAMVLVRERSGATYTAIGELFGRHHADVMHAAKSIAARCATDPGMKAQMNQIRSELDGKELCLTGG